MPTIATQALRYLRRSARIVAIVLAGAGCSDAATSPVADAPLLDTSWLLVSLEPGAPLVSATVTPRIVRIGFHFHTHFQRPSVGGAAPCNGFGGKYVATHDGRIAFDTLIATRMGCSPEALALENAFFDRLIAANFWSISTDSLVLRTLDARWLLFVRQDTTPPASPPA